AVDVQAVVPRTIGRLGAPAQGLIPPGLVGYEPVSARRSTITRPIELGRRASVMLHTLYEGPYAALAREVLGAFTAYGVQVEVAAHRAEFLAKSATDAADAFFGRWVADYPDTDGFVYTLLHTQSQWGRMCGTPETDRLLEQGRTEQDPRVRHRIYRELEAWIAERALVLPLFHEHAYRFAQPDLAGVQVRLTPPIVPYEQLRRG